MNYGWQQLQTFRRRWPEKNRQESSSHSVMALHALAKLTKYRRDPPSHRVRALRTPNSQNWAATRGSVKTTGEMGDSAPVVPAGGPRLLSITGVPDERYGWAATVKRLITRVTPLVSRAICSAS
jgi:hypothetical protein